MTLNGFTTKEQIDMACKAVDHAEPFTEEEIQRIRRHVTENMDRLCTGCQYCMDQCPKEIPIAGFMQYYNNKILGGKTDQEMTQELDFQKKWGILVDRKAEAEDCIRCGRCEMACTQHLDIIHRLDAIRAWEQDLKKNDSNSGN